MKLKPTLFETIKNGRKSIEIRLNDEKRQKISIGDEIEFTNTDNFGTLNVKVVGLTKANSFKELFEKVEPFSAGWKKDTTPEQAATNMGKYYSQEKEQEFGSLGIHIEMLN